MKIPLRNRPNWATHYMYQHEQHGVGGYWVGQGWIQKVHPDGELNGDRERPGEKYYNEYLAGKYGLTIQKLRPKQLENK